MTRPAADPRAASTSRPARESEAVLVLVRHGESTYIAEGRFQGQHDPELSVLGERQVALTAERLGEARHGTALPIPSEPPVAIWHSPLRRTARTAAAIASAQPKGIPLHARADLREIGQGAWEGRTHAEVRATWPAELERWRRAPAVYQAPDGESLADAAARAEIVLGEIVATLSDPDGDPRRWGIVVAHGGIFQIALLLLLGLPLTRFWSFPFDLCGVSVLHLRGDRVQLRAHNLTDHLEPLLRIRRAAEEARGERLGPL